MRFDAESAVALAQRLATLRLPGTAGQREAAALVAEEFERAGLSVHQTEVANQTDGAVAPAREIYPTALLAVGAGVALLFVGGPVRGLAGPWVLALIFAGLATTALVLRLLTRRRGDRTASSQPWVYARVGPESHPGGQVARVVLLTHLETRPPVDSHRYRRDIGRLELLWLAALWLPCLLVGGWAWFMTAGPALLIGLGLIQLIRRVDPWVQSQAPYPADNRTGLALLVELARTWRPTLRAPIETLFIASGGPARPGLPGLPEAGATADVPTLLVNLEAPGLGATLYLVDAPDLVTQAARDLWLPARAGGWPTVPLDHRAFRVAGFPALSLVGDLDSTAIHPEVLAATAQLVTEIALRWAGQAAPGAGFGSTTTSAAS